MLLLSLPLEKKFGELPTNTATKRYSSLRHLQDQETGTETSENTVLVK